METRRVVLDLPEWAAAAIEAAPMPVDLCGKTLAERIGYMAVEYADAEVSRKKEVEKRKSRAAMYGKLGLPLPPPPGQDDDDSIPF